MTDVTLPLGVLLLAALLVAVFAALIGHTITRWLYRVREDNLDRRALALNVQHGGYGYDLPFAPGAVAQVNGRASALVRR